MELLKGIRDWFVEDWIAATIFIVFAVAAVSLFVGLFYFLYLDSIAERFSLRKNDWNCTATRVEDTTVPVYVGNQVQYIPSTQVVCSQYTLK